MGKVMYTRTHQLKDTSITETITLESTAPAISEETFTSFVAICKTIFDKLEGKQTNDE